MSTCKISVHFGEEIKAKSEEEAIAMFWEWLDGFQLYNGDIIESNLRIEKIED